MDSSNDCEMMPVSFADILKNSQPRRRYKSECVQRTWLEQIEEFEQQELMERSISLSNIPSNNTNPSHVEKRTKSNNTSQSMDSCIVSDESLDHKILNDLDSCTDIIFDMSSEDGIRQNYVRRSSVDSHKTASTSGCSTTMDQESLSSFDSNNPKRFYEDDKVVLARRQKQIDYGKNTIGYANYRKKVPMYFRRKGDPKTPNKYLKYSRRAFDGLVEIWRKELHRFDPCKPHHVEADKKSESSSATDSEIEPESMTIT